jgi:two-component system phosphate regulon sensor histidine kinase PhoR
MRRRLLTRSRTGRAPAGPRLGMRLWLAAAFALVGLITATAVYLLISNSSERALSDRATDLAVGRTITVADTVGEAKGDVADVISGSKGGGFLAWYFDRSGKLVAPLPPGAALAAIDSYRTAIGMALDGGRFTRVLPGGEVTVVAVPVFRESGISGALLGRSSRSQVLNSAIDRLRSDSLRALGIAVLIGVLAGFIVATVIAHRVKRLARGAEEMAAGSFDVSLDTSGRDEIGDLARALDSMRVSLEESFGVLTADRDKLTAIFDGLTDAVMVVDDDGTVRFSNGAATKLVDSEGHAPEAMVPQLRRAADVGFSAHPALRIGDRAYAIQARDLPEEGAVLAVVRDRTDEMRREFAERDFVSNAAHELRNPLAGISGAIEVLQTGAKDDPEARDHFLERLSQDAERMSRLTQSLLTLARVEALGAGEEEEVDVEVAVGDVAAAVEVPEGIELTVDIDPDLAAKGDPTLLRQVLIGLLTNAYKNTPTPGGVTVRGRRDGETEVVLEVIDTGTGIPAAEIERVFERFYRRSASRQQEGFGLGLAIARRMVSVMGGRIGAASVEGEGSTFWVRLPVAQPSPTPVA